ncbi:MAG: GHMP kinase [Acidobacteria bacterium RIFCSPLOWO2_12_FULL_67_14]|nr:MAG: GHMP kinase [Acidobacteria bacterium RIFCSPLOWO2_02_FULL_67_21]OFW40073.1 MAG: GHMP kinase [Acidobacteria bacterium RIFCSPLOWO2_12_FULL_67_14]
MIVSKTPFRMSFVGGGTDLPWFYREEMGAVVSTTIDKYMYIALNRKFDDRIRISYSRTEEVETAQQVEHPLVRHALGVAGINGGIEVASMADIPSRGTGLGSSSSYTVGLLNAFFAYRNEYASKERLAQLACEIEIERCGEPIGKQDQYAAAYGGLNLIRFHPDESVSVDPVICDPAVLAELEASTLVFYTGRARSASAVLAEQYAHADANRPLMRRMVALALDLKKELESGRLDCMGPILDENWRLKRQMSDSISSSQIDDWYSTGLANGAQGGKLLGAGRGGFLMFFAPPDRHLRISRALPDLKPAKFRFERTGAQIVFYQPADGT